MADQPGFLDGVGQLSGDRREQEVRQDEDPGRDRDEDLGLRAADLRHPVQREDHERILEDVVVHGAEELRHEQRQEPAGSEQGELGLAHGRALRTVTRWLDGEESDCSLT